MGRNVDAYVDDIVVKTREERTLIDDLDEAFQNLDRKSTRLNSSHS